MYASTRHRINANFQWICEKKPTNQPNEWFSDCELRLKKFLLNTFLLWIPCCTIHGDRWDVTIKPNQWQQQWARIRYIYRRFRGIYPVKILGKSDTKQIRWKLEFFAASTADDTVESVSYAICYSRYTGTVFCIQFFNRMTAVNAHVFLLCDCHCKRQLINTHNFSKTILINQSQCVFRVLFLHRVAVRGCSFLLFTPFFLSLFILQMTIRMEWHKLSNVECFGECMCVR